MNNLREDCPSRTLRFYRDHEQILVENSGNIGMGTEDTEYTTILALERMKEEISCLGRESLMV